MVVDEQQCSECQTTISSRSKTKLCSNCKNKQWKQDNKERVRESNQKWWAKHREDRLAKAKDSYDPEAKKKWRSKYYQEHKEEELARNRAWRDAEKQNHPDRWKQKDREKQQKRKKTGYHANYYKENKEKIRKKNSEYQKNNKEALAAHSRDRYKNDIQFKLRAILRTRLNEALKNSQKTGSAVDDLGCSVDELKTYLESKFYKHPITDEPMTWDKWSRDESGWQIDHIIPMSNFDLSDPEQLKIACNFSNLRPLWYQDHLDKSIKERKL